VDDSSRVFVCHNSRDSAAARRLALDLLKTGAMRTWVDTWEVPGGEKWEQEIRHAFARSSACLVLLGSHGLGRYQRREVDWAKARQSLDPSYRVVPVLLPGVQTADVDALATALPEQQWVDLRDGFEDADRLEVLQKAIRGGRPGPPVLAINVAVAAEQWEASGRANAGVLISGKALRQARALATRGGEFDPLSLEFLAACDEAERKQVQRRFIALVVTTLVLFGAAIFANIQRIEAVEARKSEEQAKVEAVGQRNVALGAQAAERRAKEAEIAQRKEAETQRNRAVAEKNRADGEKEAKEGQRLLALGRQLAAQARLKEVDIRPEPQKALELAQRSIQTQPTQEGYTAWLSAARKLPEIAFADPTFARTLQTTFSADGKLVYTSSQGGRVRAHRVNNGVLVSELALNGEVTRFIEDVRSGHLLVAGDDQVVQWNAGRNQVVRRYRHPSPVFDLALDADSRSLHVGGAFGLRTWSLDDGTLLREESGLGNVTFVLAAADGKDALATVSKDRPTPASVGEGHFVGTLAGVFNVGAGEVVAVTSGVCCSRRIAIPHTPSAVARSRSGRLLAIGSVFGTVTLIDTEQLAVRRQIEGRRRIVRQIVFSPDEKSLFVAGDSGTIAKMSVDSNEPIAYLHHAGLVRAMVLSDDGKRLLSGGADGVARLWDVGEARARLPESPTGELLAVDSDDEITAVALSTDGHLAIGDSGFGLQVRKPAKPFPDVVFLGNGLASPRTMALSSDRKSLAIAGMSLLLKVIALAPTGTAADMRVDPSNQAMKLAFMPGDGMLAVAQMKGLTLHDLRGRQVRTLDHEGAAVFSLAVGHGASELFTGTDRGEVWRWDVASGTFLSRWKIGTPVYALATSPDGRRLAVGTDGLRVLDARTGSQLGHYRKGDAVTSVAYSPGGDRLAVGVLNGDVQVLRTSDMSVLLSVRHEEQEVADVVFSADGKLLASASGGLGSISRALGDYSLRVWDLDPQAKVRELVRLSQRLPVGAVRFDGPQSVLFVGDNDTVRRFSWGRKAVMEQTCMRLLRSLMVAEWRATFGAAPYNPACPGSVPPRDWEVGTRIAWTDADGGAVGHATQWDVTVSAQQSQRQALLRRQSVLGLLRQDRIDAAIEQLIESRRYGEWIDVAIPRALCARATPDMPVRIGEMCRLAVELEPDSFSGRYIWARHLMSTGAMQDASRQIEAASRLSVDLLQRKLVEGAKDALSSYTGSRRGAEQ
jgi:WD40 repeat protein